MGRGEEGNSELQIEPKSKIENSSPYVCKV